MKEMIRGNTTVSNFRIGLFTKMRESCNLFHKLCNKTLYKVAHLCVVILTD